MKKMQAVNKSQKKVKAEETVEDKYGAHFKFTDLCTRLKKVRSQQKSMHHKSSGDLQPHSLLRSASYLATDSSVRRRKPQPVQPRRTLPKKKTKPKLVMSSSARKGKLLGHRESKSEERLKKIFGELRPATVKKKRVVKK